MAETENKTKDGKDVKKKGLREWATEQWNKIPRTGQNLIMAGVGIGVGLAINHLMGSKDAVVIPEIEETPDVIDVDCVDVVDGEMEELEHLETEEN